MANIEDCLRDILINEIFLDVSKERILSTQSLRVDLGLNSLGFVELKHQVENHFEVSISEDDFNPENFSTISALADLIKRCQSTREYTNCRNRNQQGER